MRDGVELGLRDEQHTSVAYSDNNGIKQPARQTKLQLKHTNACTG